MPTLSSSGCHCVSVKNAQPVALQRRERLVAEERADRAGEHEHEEADRRGRAAEDVVRRRQARVDLAGLVGIG